jgi:hypothetical protein
MATEKHSAPTEAHTEVPAVIAGSVNLLKFSEALALAGLIGRHDADRGLLVIEPAQEARKPVPAWSGMAVYNGWTEAERALWHRVAASAVPADAVAAFEAAADEPPPPRCMECGGTGFEEDAACELCDGTGREGGARD